MVRHPRDATAKPAARQAPKPDDTPETGAAAGGERVAKALARAGVASRREVERMVAQGRVALNGRVLTEPGVKIEPGDILTVDGAPVEAAEATRLWRHHKPAGLLTTNADPRGRPTVFERLPQDLPRVIAVGRLDLATEGLLLLTNDGALARALELPATGWVRRYRARAYGRVTQERLDALKDGVTVEGVRYGPIEARIDKATGAGARSAGAAPANLWISVALAEGRNREVRRVLESLGLKVNRLIRLAYGPFALGALPAGEVEEVGPRVIREQLAGLVAEASMPAGDRVAPRPRAPDAGPLRRSQAAAAGEGGARGKAAPKRPRGTLIEAPGRGGATSSAKRPHGARPAAPGAPDGGRDRGGSRSPAPGGKDRARPAAARSARGDAMGRDDPARDGQDGGKPSRAGPRSRGAAADTPAATRASAAEARASRAGGPRPPVVGEPKRAGRPGPRAARPAEPGSGPPRPGPRRPGPPRGGPGPRGPR